MATQQAPRRPGTPPQRQSQPPRAQTAPPPPPEESDPNVYNPDESYEDGFVLVSEGPHLAQVFAADVVEVTKEGSKYQGAPMWALTLTIIGESDSDRDRTVKDWCIVTRNFFWKIQQIQKAAHPELRKGDGFDPADQGSVNRFILDKPVAIEVVHEERNDKPGQFNAKIAIYRAITAEEQKVLEEQYGGNLTPGVAEEEIPF